MNYTLDLTPSQSAIETKLRTLITGSRLAGFDISDVYVDGLIQSEEVATYSNGVIKPFIVVWFGNLRRRNFGRNFGSPRLDSHTANVDVIVVADNGTKVRNIINILDDELVGWKPSGTVGMENLYKGSALWNDTRMFSLDTSSVPERWAGTTNYEFVPFARKIV